MDLNFFRSLEKTVTRLSGKYFLNGEIYEPHTSHHIPVVSPIYSSQIGYISVASEEDVDRAVSYAKIAQFTWRQMNYQTRAQFLRQCGKALSENKEELAYLMSFETGKAVRTESRMEVEFLEEIFNYYAGLALEVKGETLPLDTDVMAFTLREPLGVVGAIVPWNVPLMLMCIKIAPALLTGNTIVIKASPESSLITLRAAEIIGTLLPKGVLNVITGDGFGTGSFLVKNLDIAKITFTGSVEAGRDVYKNAASKLIPVTLELGGKSPFIVYPDADLDEAVQGAINGMRFTRQGQSCSAASRLFIHCDVYDCFLAKLKESLKKMVIGNPLEEETDIGTVISKKQYEKIMNYVNLAKNDSSLTVHEIGIFPQSKDLQNALYILPTLITGIQNDHILCQEEIFGPVTCIMSWENENDVFEKANATEYGLAAAIWTKDLSQALQGIKKLDAGFVQVNQYKMFRPGIAFGGFKNSGLGKEASKNSMIENFTREKMVLICL